MIAGAFCWLAITGHADAQVTEGDLYGQHTYGSWSGAYVSAGADKRFRAYTANPENWGISVDVLPPKCGIAFAVVFVGNGNSLERDIPRANYAGALRVDQQELWSINLASSGAMGDRMLIYQAYPISGIERLIDQMSNGQLLRVKITVAGQDYYPTFQLNGFANAFNTEYKACQIASTPDPAPAPKQRLKKQLPPPDGKFL